MAIYPTTDHAQTTPIYIGSPDPDREASDGCTIIRVRNGYVLDYLVPGGEDKESLTFIFTNINDLFAHLREVFNDQYNLLSGGSITTTGIGIGSATDIDGDFITSTNGLPDSIAGT